ncbi:tRNA 2-selenouridine(34) synthase MnmH [Paenibacillus xylaniclasticus]|uniref:tRNA 2-selenouridine(34) synthase MnmH n=1 Tax=Paenibacillus xylaniclasticus TaxID=588083 RepID=UPI000FD91F2F|nr:MULTISPECIES: tRNA 2-selenouridine(34) synthase MnmH [Paenibacillus]GFN31455.1 tRNA 2-selenouridine synthase [Paenibacillus curdlanolyticus]
MFQDISIEELFALKDKKEIVTIDVRSPSEYAESTIPGSLNIPLFDDAERAEVGTIYKQVSVQAAKDRGLELFSAKLPAFIKAFEQIKDQKAVFCWRGGMRSKTTATVLSLMGIRVYRLTGGYRTYRRWVVETLEHFELKPRPIVLLGHTGTGKTVILRQLQDEGHPVLDLEGMAGHRGSIFGHVGLKAHNQKTFDSLLLNELLKYEDSPYVLLEGESKRIGKVVLPEFLLNKKKEADQLFIQLPIEERVRHIVEDYEPWNYKQELMKGFNHIRDRIHTPIAKQIGMYLEADQFHEAVRLLLEYYYDPRYEYAMQQYEQARVVIDAKTIAEATQAIKAYLSRSPNVMNKLRI